MARQELVSGIRQAVSKGESLRDAMVSFLNAGYSKEDIEDAARIVQGEGIENTQPKIEIKKPIVAPEIPKKEYIEQATPIENIPSAPAMTQKVSAYTSKPSSSMSASKKIFLVVLFIFLTLIGVSLAALFIYKDQ